MGAEKIFLVRKLGFIVRYIHDTNSDPEIFSSSLQENDYILKFLKMYSQRIFRMI